MGSLLADVVFAIAFPFVQKEKPKVDFQNFEDDPDLQSFLKWFDKLDVEDDDATVSVAPCEPTTIDPITTTKQVCNGKVTSIVDDHGLIDDHIYFHMKDIVGNVHLPSVDDEVHVQAEQTRAGGGWRARSVTLVKEEEEVGWDEKLEASFKLPTVHEERGQMMGEITNVSEDGMSGTIGQEVSFEMKNTVDRFKPNIGDWVQANVAKGGAAIDVKPVRTKHLTGTVSYVPRVDKGRVCGGTINDDIHFEKSDCCDNYFARKGDTVAVTAIESKQGRNTWRATEVKFIGRSNSKSTKSPSHRSGAWVLRGDRPESSSKNPAIPSFLPAFAIPDSLRTCVSTGGNVLSLCTKLNEPLSPNNFSEKFSTLLHLEELALEKEILSFTLQNIGLTRRGEFLVLNVPGISDGKPGLFVGDVVVLRKAELSGTFEAMNSPEHHGFIHHIFKDSEDLLIKFHDQLYYRFEESDRFDASFTYSRTPFRRSHLAVSHAEKRYAKDLLFPLFKNSTTTIYRKKPQHFNQTVKNAAVNLGATDASSHKFFNPDLNDRQKSAVHRILWGEARPKPYILFGPPGTGKTVTLVEAILQILAHVPSARLLVCAPSNSAVDLLCERLHGSGKVTTETMVRFNAFRRPPQAIPERIQKYCHVEEPLSVTARYKVVLTTCVNSGQFYSLILRSDHFTHVYVDEAGQATEPECLVPIGLGAKGQIVLTGDPEQLGAVLKSSYSSHYGLGVSLLQRLMSSSEYARNVEFHSDGYNPLLVTKLVNNYRSHPALLTVSSALFYDNELQYCAPKPLSDCLCDWDHLPQKNFPLIFHGIIGAQLREETCPSWFNACEIVQVSRYVKLLLNSEENECSTEDIGIITPYKKQVEKTRMMLRALQVEGLKVGSVEEFQGQERKVIILSTVRSTQADQLSDDDSLLAALGFVANPRRFNVAITRAKALMIVVGNPFVLSKDKYWMALLEHAIANKGYIGCDISSVQRCPK